MKGLISLKAFANEISDLNFIDEVKEIEDDLINIKIHDDRLKLIAYEFDNKYFTDDFVIMMKVKLEEIWVMCMGMISQFVKLDIQHLEDDWFSIGVKAK